MASVDKNSGGSRYTVPLLYSHAEQQLMRVEGREFNLFIIPLESNQHAVKHLDNVLFQKISIPLPQKVF